MATNADWRPILTVYGIGVVGAIQVGRVAPAAETIRESFSMSLTTLGWAVSLVTLASALFGLLAGIWVARRGPRFALLSGSLLLAACVLASSLSPSVPVLLVTRMLEGFGYLAIVVAAPTLIAHEAKGRQRVAALALWGTFFTLGLSLAAVAGGVIATGWGWRGWYGANAVLVAGAALVGFLVLRPVSDTFEVDSDSTAAPTRIPLASWLLAGSFLGLTLVSLSILSWMPTFLTEVHGFPLAEAGAVTGLVALTGIAGSLLFGLLSVRVGETPIICAAAGLLVLSAYPTFGEAFGSAVAITSAGLAIFASGVLVAFTFAAVPRLVVDPSRIGPANGVVAQSGSVGAFIGPPMVGGVVGVYGWNAVSALIVLFTLGFLGLALAANKAAVAQA